MIHSLTMWLHGCMKCSINRYTFHNFFATFFYLWLSFGMPHNITGCMRFEQFHHINVAVWYL